MKRLVTISECAIKPIASETERREAGCAAPAGSAIHGATYKELDDANAALSAENARLRSALEGWVKYFQADVPMTSDAMEEQGEAFTHCWFETQKALSPNEESSDLRVQPEA